MEYKDIKRLIDDVGSSELSDVEIEFPDGIKIKMKKNLELKNSTSVVVPISQVTEVCEEKQENYNIVKSPMVGTFYASPSPKEAPYVKVGDKVKKGDVLCIVEAMKLMNEIESEYDGEIVEICANNEDVVEYGTTLFKIK